MANFTIDYFSNALRRFTQLKLFYPCDTPPEMAEVNPAYKRKTKTFILLHGYSGYNGNWPDGSLVMNLAMKYNLAVACPSGENSFYLNQKGTGRAYGDFVGKELITFLQNTFGLAQAREDTYIGGFSMGGFGAVHAGLSQADTFGGILALSPAYIVHEVAEMRPGKGNAVADYDYYALTFGEPEKLLDSDNNPETLIKKLKTAGKAIPDIFLACGTEDFLLKENRCLNSFLEAEGVPVSYHEGPGMHDWDFWNKWVEPGIRYLLHAEQGERQGMAE